MVENWLFSSYFAEVVGHFYHVPQRKTNLIFTSDFLFLLTCQLELQCVSFICLIWKKKKSKMDYERKSHRTHIYILHLTKRSEQQHLQTCTHLCEYCEQRNVTGKSLGSKLRTSCLLERRNSINSFAKLVLLIISGNNVHKYNMACYFNNNSSILLFNPKS